MEKTNKIKFEITSIVEMALKNIDKEMPAKLKAFKESKMKGQVICNTYLTSFKIGVPRPIMEQVAGEMTQIDMPEISEKLHEDYPEISFEKPRLFLSFDEEFQCWDINLLVAMELKE
ncbi:hypothetical protein [Odoribacter lunatus]|uniref:hypothetical protein n=1 Tax=Odoribacter lunatus TaxID=2941335 RepID=UPI00203B9BE2|nr:hypothetical protein [Odoribacter lunatus]